MSQTELKDYEKYELEIIELKQEIERITTQLKDEIERINFESFYGTNA